MSQFDLTELSSEQWQLLNKGRQGAAPPLVLVHKKKKKKKNLTKYVINISNIIVYVL